MRFELIRAGRSEFRTLDLCRVVIAGWTGRDPAKVREHIWELASLGVAPPRATPCFYRVGLELLSTASSIDCIGDQSSGEAEFIIVVDEAGAWWVGLGSDHTDRHVETYSIPVSKQICPKPVASALWAYEEVADHWDALELRSWVDDGAGLTLYQEGTLAGMLDPRQTARAYVEQGHGEIGPGTLMFGGTFAALGGIRPRQRLRMELRDPIHERGLVLDYETRWLPFQES
ncbi:hypothetical protein PIGHUM_00084 [Pigmentiphaga humi]|uniref:DUF2848 domain-containing protein n=1 Tax=Pigmentiphaga humi TaxID=2478468 RepID=A0A3P4AVJ5_9BURK|nr:DUF2848 family protein [Pigmentiphaga humi]VCU68037.1 hypothetical protein PIGHUM_00084 [Pigmentiphaga humi]